MDESSDGCLARTKTVFLVLSTAATLVGCRNGAKESSAPRGIPVVAAENFYGDVARQIGAGRVQVTSVLENRNINPHEYEPSVQAAKAIYQAKLVIENGGGYDAWMDRLLSASPNRHRILINAYDRAVVRLPHNEHVWYDFDNMIAVAEAIGDGLGKLDPLGAARYDRNFQRFQQSLAPLRAMTVRIKSRFAGTPIALTETVFQYQAVALGLKVQTPFAFQKAIAQGTDPPASAAIAAEHQIRQRQVKLLVYNAQTIDRITAKLLEAARNAGVPVVGVTETMPSGMHYQSWMLAQLDRLEAALIASDAKNYVK